MTEITPDLLRQLLTYEPETGRLFWKERPPEMFGDGNKHRSREHYAAHWNKVHAGKEAFTTTHSYGYKTGTVKKKRLYAHRVIWALHHGRWPEGEIDHINGDQSDNRISNLRDVDHATNGRNTRRATTNSSGTTGVVWAADRQRWVAQIHFDGRVIHLGRFLNIEDAIAARKAAEAAHRFHPNHGRTANG